MGAHCIYIEKNRQNCVFRPFMCLKLFKLCSFSYKYVAFGCVFAYRPYFDLQLLFLDVLILPQMLFTSNKKDTSRKRGRPLIHEGTIIFFLFLSHCSHICTVFGVGVYRIGRECINVVVCICTSVCMSVQSQSSKLLF